MSKANVVKLKEKDLHKLGLKVIAADPEASKKHK